MIASVTHIGPRANECKSAGQLAYEAAGEWATEHDVASKKALPTWEMLDARAHEYWDRVGTSARAPLISAIKAFVDCDKGRPSAREASLGKMLAAAGLAPASSIRGLW